MSAGLVVFGRVANATSAAGRVYPQILPQQGTYPAVTYQEISSVRTHAMGQDGPIIRVRVQVTSWAKSYAEARTLASEVETRLSRYKGEIVGTKVLDVLLDNEIDMAYESETQTRRVTQDYTIFIAR